MSELLKVQLEDENGNVYYLHTSADVVFCEDGQSVSSKLTNTIEATNKKIDKTAIVQNATTTATDKVPSAAVAKNLQDQITENKNELSTINSALETERQEKSVSEYLPTLILYRDNRTVYFRCVGYSKQAMQAGQDYQFGTLPIGFRPNGQIIKYETYNSQGSECGVTINADGTASIRFFDAIPAQTGMNINFCYVAKKS